MQGYEQFFKQARKASQPESLLFKGKSKSAGNSAGKFAEKSAEKLADKSTNPRFNLASPEKQGTAEQRLKKELELRIRQKQVGKMARRKAPFPTGALMFAIVGLAVGVTGLIFPDSVEWVQEHVEIGVFGNAKAETASAPADKATAGDKGDAAKNKKKDETAAGAKGSADGANTGENPGAKAEEKSAGPDDKAAEKSADKGKTDKKSTMPDTKSWSAEEVSFFDKLDERKHELDLREAELSKLEEELQKQKVELDDKIKQLESMRSKIAQTLKTRVESDQEKVGKLVDVYAGMKPQQAAKVLESVNEDLAVQVLDRMKKKNASDILNVMDSKKAQKLSEMLAGYQRP